MGIIRKYLQNHKKGYTLIEVLIVVTMLGVLMPTVFSVLYVILQQQLKVYRISETKRQGDYVLQFMKEKIQQDTAYMTNNGATPRCATAPSSRTETNGNNLRFRYTNDTSFWFNVNSNRMRYRDVGGVDTHLTTQEVSINNFEIGCNKKSNAAPAVVSFRFRVTYNDPTPTTAEGTVALNYVSKVQLLRR